MKRHKLLSWVLSLVMALTVFSIPVGGVCAQGEGNPEYCLGWVNYLDTGEEVAHYITNGDTIDYSSLNSAGIRTYVKNGEQWDYTSTFTTWTMSPSSTALFGYYDEMGEFRATSDTTLENVSTVYFYPQGAQTIDVQVDFYKDDSKTDLVTTQTFTVTVSQDYLTSKFKGYLYYWDMNAAYADYTDKYLFGSLPNENTYNYDRGSKPEITNDDLRSLTITVKVGSTTYHPTLVNIAEGNGEDYEFEVDFSKAANLKLGTRVTITYSICGVTRTEKRTVGKWVNPKLSSKSYTYDGKYHKAAPTVKVGTTALKKNSEYYFDSSSRKNVGTGTYMVWFDDENSKYFFNDKKGTFRINPKGTYVKSLKKAKKAFTVNWAKQAMKMSTSRITGYQIQYSTSSAFTKKTTKTVFVKGYSTTSKKIKKLKKKKTYYVRVRTYKTVNKVNYYSAWSKRMSVKTK